MSKSAFERYAPFIQEYIYKKNWKDLREVQVEACNAILDTDKHVIIASGTASGKTEAAFFPILTTLQANPSNSIGVMYIGPLKALINDQFQRLSGLLEESYIPVWPWHGDISQSVKNRARKEATGVLQITPESLEALLMLHTGDVSHLFSDLRFVIIDEIHALMGTDRGLQVLCLLSRMEKIAKCTPRRIGLSATLNDYEPAMRYIASGSKRDSIAVGISAQKRTIALCAESFVLPEDEKQAQIVKNSCNEFIYDNCHDKKCLIFVNNRGRAEEVIANMKDLALQREERDVFFVHHGSVSAALRNEAETALRDKVGPTVAAATLTLELGIDIGDLDSTIQLGAPFSCASFVQRLGRSGRRTEKSQMLFINQFEQLNGDPFSSLPWELLRIIAIIQLYLEERWVEPFLPKPKPFSLLVHQTLSTLMTYGETSPAELASRVLTLPAFQTTISQDEYRDLLLYMVENDFLQRVDSGGLIVGLEGEKITNHYSFFAVFKGDQGFHVQSKDGEIGTLDNCPAVDEVFVLAGRSWKVQAIDEARKIIYVFQVKNRRIPSWNGTGGDIHSKIVERMKKVLLENDIYPYLRPNAVQVLIDARINARRTQILDRNVIPINDNAFYLSPWVGTKELRSISSLLLIGLKESLQIQSITQSLHYLQIRTALSPATFVNKVRHLIIETDNPDLVLSKLDVPVIDKYDTMVPVTLLRKAFLYNDIDLPNAIAVLRQINY